MENIAFVEITHCSDESLRGGILVTNIRTEPVEFRCTDRVRPTLLQKTLWGGRLPRYLAVEIVGKPLIDALTEGPSLVLIRNPDLLELRLRCDIPVGLVAADDLDDFPKVDTRPLGMAGAPENTRLNVGVHLDYASDREVVERSLKELCEFCYPLEPFERIVQALEVIDKQRSRKKAAQ